MKKRERPRTAAQDYVEQLLTGNYAKYYRIAYSYVGNEADAQDVVQEGAYRAILNCDSLKNVDYADTWICRIIINESLALLKRKGRESVGLDEHMVSGASEDTEPDLHDVMEMLGTEDRAVIVLRFFEEMKLEQIAAVTGENLSTVKSRLYRALRKLRVILEKETAREKLKGGAI